MYLKAAIPPLCVEPLTPAPLPSGEGRLEMPFSLWEKGMG
jgi:hypothetical protein